MLEIINSTGKEIKIPGPWYNGEIYMKPYELKSFDDEKLKEFYEPYRVLGLVSRIGESLKEEYQDTPEKDLNLEDVESGNGENLKKSEEVVEDAAVIEEDSKIEGVLEDFDKMSWKELKSAAKEREINTYGMSKDDVIKALKNS